jgi:hypothetical protein
MEMQLPEELNMWKEKVEVEETEDQTKDPFIPAKKSKMNPDEAYVYVEL